MHEYVLADDSSWDHFLKQEDRESLDPNIRLIARLIDIGDFDQVFRRTGVRLEPDGSVADGDWLPVFLDLFPGKDKRLETLGTITTQVMDAGGQVTIDDAAVSDLLDHATASIVMAGVRWKSGVQTQSGASPKRGNDFRQVVAPFVHAGGVRRAAMPNVMQPCLQPSLKDIGLPHNRKFNGITLTGEDVIVGIIDDGCALAHPNFLVPGATAPTSRVQYLWDQNLRAYPAPWTPLGVPGFSYIPHGAEIDNQAINTVLQNHIVDELIDQDGVYEELGYDIDITSHGTHVMDIAAGNGASLLGTEGIARLSDIIFVQLPSPLVEDALPLLDSSILAAVQYIFKRAADVELKRGKHMPVVINISYGGYTGPHDGTSHASKGIDDQLKGYTDRAVVISAGNSFEADCHAQGTIDPGAEPYSLRWNLSPEDPTANPMEIWYEEDSLVSMALTMPENEHIFATLHLGEAKVLMRDGLLMGWMENVRTGGGLPNVIRILLNSTVHEAPGTAADEPVGPTPQPPDLTAPCPSGTWTIELYNDKPQPAPFHAWIGRDDWRRGVVSTHQQSRFAPSDADPTSTVVDLATGHLAICVGAHNGDTGETCGYSAAGPTRDGRPKPDVTAPAEEDASCRGILCASSRRAQPTWFNGTSASAPIVAGIVALILQYNRDTHGPPLAPARILALLKNGAVAGHLVGNKRQDVDPRRPQGKKQADCLEYVTGAGKVRVTKSMP